MMNNVGHGHISNLCPVVLCWMTEVYVRHLVVKSPKSSLSTRIPFLGRGTEDDKKSWIYHEKHDFN